MTADAAGKGPERPASRRELFRWLGWFSLANAGLYLLVALRYLPAYQWPGSLTGPVYVLVTMLGHFALLAVLPLFLVAGTLTAVRPSRRLVTGVAVLIAATSLALLILDTNVFVERRFHLSLFTAVLFETPTWIASGVILAIALVFEAMLAGGLWRWLQARSGSAGGRAIGAALALCWLVSQGLHIWADGNGYSPVTRFTAIMPLYYPIRAKNALAGLGLLDEERVREARLLRQGSADADGDLRYPLKPLQCAAPAGPALNVVWILIDALRPDAIDPVLTPNLAGIRGTGQAFADHWSGGNSSRMGLFSMFYGLPSTYWQSFYSAQQPPVLMDEFRRYGYELMTSSAVGYGGPTLIDRTVFSGVSGLKPESAGSGISKNSNVTRDWLRWLAGRGNPGPFFAFLYYDPPMSDMPGEGPEPLPMDDRYRDNARARKMWRQYRLGVRMVDGEVAKVMASIEMAGLRDDTLVLVTSDHGYEFDDLGLGYYGHASNFGQYQLRATLLMQWPGREPRIYAHRTSHLDLPATLLEGLFGCRNPPADYSLGRNLFDGVSWDWIIAGSYHAHAIVTPGRVMISEPGGFAEVLGPDYRPPADPALDTGLIEKTMTEMRRFYR